MDAVEFLEQYKLMCGHHNRWNKCKGCPIKPLLDRHRIEFCDDAFIYLHPEEVVIAVQEWSNRNGKEKKT